MTKYNPNNKQHIEHPWNVRAGNGARKAKQKVKWVGHPTDWQDEKRTHYYCPWCGVRCATNDKRGEVFHPPPECDQYARVNKHETSHHVHNGGDVSEQGPSPTNQVSSPSTRGKQSRDDSMGQEGSGNRKRPDYLSASGSRKV